MPYFIPAKGLLDIPALWGHKLKPNSLQLDRPRITPREPILAVRAISTPGCYVVLGYPYYHNTSRAPNKGQSPDLTVLPCGLSVCIPEQELCRDAATLLVSLPSSP
jgi:hypothetical protein